MFMGLYVLSALDMNNRFLLATAAGRFNVSEACLPVIFSKRRFFKVATAFAAEPKVVVGRTPLSRKSVVVPYRAGE